MKIDKSVRDATALIAVGTLCLSAVMEVVYLIVVLIAPTLTYSYTFPLGNLLMGVAVVLNFFLMALTIQNAVSGADPALAKKKIQTSQALRSLALVGVLVAGFLLPCFHIVSVVITISFPQLTVFLSRLIHRPTAESTAVAGDDTVPGADGTGAAAMPAVDAADGTEAENAAPGTDEEGADNHD